MFLILGMSVNWLRPDYNLIIIQWIWINLNNQDL